MKVVTDEDYKESKEDYREGVLSTKNNLKQDSQEVLKQQDKDEFQSLSEELERLEEKVWKELEKNQELYKKLQEKLEKSDTYLVTVLGIFTAIVVTFVGSFAFASPILSSIAHTDIHRLIFVVLCFGVFIASILRWLFDFLLKISGKETKDSTWWWLLIIFLFLILLACDFCEYRMEKILH